MEVEKSDIEWLIMLLFPLIRDFIGKWFKKQKSKKPSKKPKKCKPRKQKHKR